VYIKLCAHEKGSVSQWHSNNTLRVHTQGVTLCYLKYKTAHCKAYIIYTALLLAIQSEKWRTATQNNLCVTIVVSSFQQSSDAPVSVSLEVEVP
jgi:hypothetical protein